MLKAFYQFPQVQKKIPYKKQSPHLIFFMLVIRGMIKASTAQIVGTEKKMMQMQFQMVTPAIQHIFSI
jgi:hypothetical protein